MRLAIAPTTAHLPPPVVGAAWFALARYAAENGEQVLVAAPEALLSEARSLSAFGVKLLSCSDLPSLIEWKPDALIIDQQTLIADEDLWVVALALEIKLPYFIVIRRDETETIDRAKVPLVERYFAAASEVLFSSRAIFDRIQTQLSAPIPRVRLFRPMIRVETLPLLPYSEQATAAFASFVPAQFDTRLTTKLLSVFADRRWQERQWSLTLVAPQHERLSSLVRSLGLSKRICMSERPRNLSAFWGSFHYLLLCAPDEPELGGIIEAMLSGRPCAVAELRPLPGVVRDGRNGAVCYGESPTLLAEMLERIWRSREDWPRLGLQAREDALHYLEVTEPAAVVLDTIHRLLNQENIPPHTAALDSELFCPPRATEPRPRISVIIPCYNYAEYLRACVESVLAQTNTDFEIILVNPSSTDNTFDLIQELRTQYPHRIIRVLHQPNHGQPAYSRNNGIRAAWGEYILCLDADDLLAPPLLEKTAAVLDAKPEVAVAYTALQCFEESREIIPKGPFEVEALRAENRIAYCALYRRSAWDAVGGYRTNVPGYEDWDFWLELASRGLSGQYIEEILFLYRLRRTSSYLSKAENEKHRLLAQLVLNHPSVYPPAMVTQAQEAIGTAQPPHRRGFREPKVSVVIACYNHQQYLEECVASVAAQTLDEWECIIVDDGSTDDSGRLALTLLERYKDRDLRILQKENGGLASARNFGIRAAWGDYVFVLDADDRIAPTMLEATSRVLDSSPRVGFAYTDIQHFGARNDVWRYPDFDPQQELFCDNIVCGNALIRRTMWEQVGGYSESMREGYEDWDFWVGCIEQGWSGHCVHEPLFWYRQREGSMRLDANKKRELLLSRIILNHARLYPLLAVNHAWRTLSRTA